MRLVRIGLVFLVAAPFVALAAGGRAAAPRSGGCAAPVPRIAARLPAALTIRTACGAFEVASDGTVGRVPFQSPLSPLAHASWPLSGLWTGSLEGHLLVGRWQRTLWRSQGRFRNEYEVGTIAVGGRALAFSFGWRRPKLFVARFAGREHLAARGEYPLGWTRGGFYAHPDHHAAILFRAADGSLRATIAHHVLATAYQASSRSLWFVARGDLFRAHGERVRGVARLKRLRLTAGRSLELLPLGKLVGLQERYRLVLLHPGGSLFATTRLPPGRRGWPWITGQPTGGAVDGIAFAAMRARTPNSNHPIERGLETVYLLRPGARHAVPLHTEPLRFNPCGHGADLTWHGHWLLYSTGEGNTAVIDTRHDRTIELTSLVRRLPGFKGDDSGPFSASWH